MLLTFLTIATHAKTITVCPNGCEHTSIQVAIDASSPGDTVEVYSGTCNEEVVMNKDVTLRGVNTGGGNPNVGLIWLGDNPHSAVRGSFNIGMLNSGYPNSNIMTDSNIIVVGGKTISPIESPIAQATTISVGPSGFDHTSIQAAIDAANPGDSIEIHSGTYYENVIVDKRLTLRGVDTGKGSPVVNAGGNGNAITLSASGVILEGFCATNAGGAPGDGIQKKQKTTILYSGEPRAGIKIISDNNIIRGNDVSNNHVVICHENLVIGTNVFGKLITPTGVGIYLCGSDNNTITDNTVSNNCCGGFDIDRSDHNTIIGNVVTSNDGSGISIKDSSNNIICQNSFVDNTRYNACDNGNNQWDNGIVGNYYGDFKCSDADNDGICDSEYNIPQGDSMDRFPLASDDCRIGSDL